MVSPKLNEDSAWDHLAQLQFITFKIFIYKISK